MNSENSFFGAASPLVRTYLMVWGWTINNPEVAQLLERTGVYPGAPAVEYACSIIDQVTGGIFRAYRVVCTDEQRTLLCLLVAGHRRIRLATAEDRERIETYYANVASQAKSRGL